MKERKQKRQNKESATELMLSVREGLSLEIWRRFRISNSKVEFEKDKTENSCKEIVWQVSVDWLRILQGYGWDRFLSVQAETPMCSEIRVCKWRACLPCSARSTLQFLNHKRSQRLGNPVTEGKEISYAQVRLEDEAKVNLRKARRDEFDKFGANFQ